jgi:hypothetical protein
MGGFLLGFKPQNMALKAAWRREGSGSAVDLRMGSSEGGGLSGLVFSFFWRRMYKLLFVL